MELSTIIQLVLGGGFVSTLYGLFKIRSENKKIMADASKSGADATAVLAGSAVNLIAPYEKAVDMLEGRLDEANAEIEKLKGKLREAYALIEQLETRVRTMGRELDDLKAGQ